MVIVIDMVIIIDIVEIIIDMILIRKLNEFFLREIKMSYKLAFDQKFHYLIKVFFLCGSIILLFFSLFLFRILQDFLEITCEICIFL